MADFGGPDLTAFRTEVRSWLSANFPAALAGKGAPEGRELTPDQDAWRKAVGDKGWGVPTWPKAYGGGGLSKAEARAVSD
ncbi:MAG: acyl-CoA dehydrogenase family protein, partial [Phenylobacterium sp.]|nr:acyl-CoA dehydrogenase family protein [Phenylobacterium sp.]